MLHSQVQLKSLPPKSVICGLNRRIMAAPFRVLEKKNMTDYSNGRHVMLFLFTRISAASLLMLQHMVQWMVEAFGYSLLSPFFSAEFGIQSLTEKPYHPVLRLMYRFD